MDNRMTSFDKRRQRLMKRLRLKPCIVPKYLVFIDSPVWVLKQ